MGSFIEKIAFIDGICTYDKNIQNLIFVTRNDISLSKNLSFDIPVRHLHINEALPTILFCHGNGEDIGLYDLNNLSKIFKANICIFDYAGYGLHTQKISTENECQKDVIAVYDYLTLTKNIDPIKIIIYGRSLGSGIACYLAHHLRNNAYQPKKLILVSPLYSASHVITDIWVPFNIFMNYKLAPEIKCSTLILHGNNDQVVPFKSGYELSLCFPNLYEFVTLRDCDHNNIGNVSSYYEKINKFINA